MRKLLSLTLVCLTLAACNVFEGSSRLGQSNDPIVLLSDANTAIQQGKPEEAVRILQKAITKTEPDTKERRQVEVRLATAHLQTAGLSALTLQQLTNDFTDQIEHGASSRKTVMGAEVCSFPASHTKSDRIELDEIKGYAALKLGQSTLNEVMSIVNAALKVSGRPRGQFDIDASISTLQRLGLSDTQISELLVNGALTYLGVSFHAIAQAGGNEISWYRVVGQDGKAYAGYCAPSQAVIDAVENETACSMSDFDFAVRLLQARTRFFAEGTLAHDVASEAHKALEQLRTELGGSCAG